MSRHDELVNKLKDAIEELHKVKEESFNMGIFLHQSINLNADDETLARIVADVEQAIQLRKK
jgi:uncharacterized protein YktB (UPF0637 family)